MAASTINISELAVKIQGITLLLNEINTINEDIKVLKEDIKNLGINPALAMQIAKAKANGETSVLLDKSEELISLINSLNSKN
jgi:hypothetical protein